KSSPGFDDAGLALPAEMLPHDVAFAAVHFNVTTSALVPRGQTVNLPPGRRLYILAASANGDRPTAFGGRTMNIQQWSGYIGQWDNRTWTRKEEELPPRPDAPRSRCTIRCHEKSMRQGGQAKACPTVCSRPM